jgi:ribonuclease HI
MMDESWEPEVLLFTDGACGGNPGPGGWAFILKHPKSGRELESSGAEWETTNNRMELQAVIEGLSLLKRGTRVQIVTDSAYVMNGVTQWMRGWKLRGWMRKTSSGRKPVKNVDLWKRLDVLLSGHTYRFQHVRGHRGHPENERCDELAVEAYRKLRQSK